MSNRLVDVISRSTLRNPRPSGVADTRAGSAVCVALVNLSGRGERCSPLLVREVLVSLFSIGARVAQPAYGAGTVMLSNEYHTIIDFDEHGSRTFATSMVQLEPTNTIAPERPKRAPRKKAAPRLAKL